MDRAQAQDLVKSLRSAALPGLDPRRAERGSLVVFRDATGPPVLEAHQVEGASLGWRYSPKHRDGRNAERQERFAKAYGGTELKLPLPGHQSDRLNPRPESGLEPAYLPRSAAKLYRMADQLRRSGRTSFIV